MPLNRVEEEFEAIDYSRAHLFSRKAPSPVKDIAQVRDERAAQIESLKKLKDEIKQRSIAIQTMLTLSSPAQAHELQYLRKLQEIDRAQVEALKEKIEALYNVHQARI